jgi:hypothetical protein
MGSLYIDEHVLSFAELNIGDKSFSRKFQEVNSTLLNLGATQKNSKASCLTTLMFMEVYNYFVSYFI